MSMAMYCHLVGTDSELGPMPGPVPRNQPHAPQAPPRLKMALFMAMKVVAPGARLWELHFSPVVSAMLVP